jgi:ADP-ribosyl-[dinitrogen reductase] hydrolase
VRVAHGEIGMTLCPGKRGDSFSGGRWERDLATDIRMVREWGASTVVTLMEAEELKRLGVAGIGDAVESAGMDWHHLPIVDVDVPDTRFENLWVYSGHVLRRALTAGKKILLHCRGGLGRTGTIAARLLIEMGEQPSAAITKIRTARPGAIETSEQERYVLDVQSQRTDPELLDQVLGCLLGGAVGDALGYAVEFDSWNQIQRKFGADGITRPEAQGGQFVVSDDTQMTLFTLDGLNRSADSFARRDLDAVVESIRLAYLDWLYTQGETAGAHRVVSNLANEPTLRKRRAPGVTCIGALREGGNGNPDIPLNDSKGCGGVMRVAPIGLLRELAATDAAELAARSAALTHGHPSGYLSAAAMAAIVKMNLEGADLAANARSAGKIISKWQGNEETNLKISEALDAAQKRAGDHRAVIENLGGGWTGEEALAIALYSALVGRSFPEVLTIAANHTGDSDSTASIAGQLYGAAHGLADLPNHWVRKLDILEVLLRLVGTCLRAD